MQLGVPKRVVISPGLRGFRCPDLASLKALRKLIFLLGSLVGCFGTGTIVACLFSCVDIAVAKDAAAALRDLADRLVSDPGLTSLTADTLALDFMASRQALQTFTSAMSLPVHYPTQRVAAISAKSHVQPTSVTVGTRYMRAGILARRAPPHPEHLPERGDPPSFTSRVRSAGKGYCRVLPCPQPSADVLDAYLDEKKFVKVRFGEQGGLLETTCGRIMFWIPQDSSHD